MRVGFQEADFEALADLWARVHPERYHVTAALLRAKTTESPLFDWGASFIELRDGAPVGFTAVKRSAGRLYKGPDTLAWFTSARGGEDYSVWRMRLDVSPVRMAQPLYRPWAAEPTR